MSTEPRVAVPTDSLVAGSTPHPEHRLPQFPTSLRGKRILLCTESFGPVNGVSRTTLMLVNYLRSHGAQVAVVSPDNHTNHNPLSPPSSPMPAPADRPRQQPQPDVRVAGYPLPFNPELSIVYPVRNSTLYSRTFGFAAPPDLIYLASPASLGFQVLLQLRLQPRESRVPVVCSFQTDLAAYCAILFPSPLSHLAIFAFAAVQSYLFRHASVRTIFYPSRSAGRYLASQHIPEHKLELLASGVDTELFDPARRSEQLRKELAPSGEVIFIAVSRVAGEKGFDFLAKAAKELDVRRVPFKLYVVGGNRNPHVLSQVQTLFEPLREQGKVIFAGFKAGDDLATAYASADVFLHCSVTETFGLVVLESMASGVPVVARDKGGPSDIVQHGATGLLVSPDDLAAFVAAATSLAQDAQLRQRMATASRAAACEATWDKINIRVAWRMADMIAERGRGKPPPTGTASTPVYGCLARGKATAREMLVRRAADARLVGGLAVIASFWAATGCYVAFTEMLLWAKGRVCLRRRRGACAPAAKGAPPSSMPLVARGGMRAA